MINIGEKFVWWFGVVEDRNDPLKLGRVRVRCLNWHNKNKTQVPTEHLPWAQPIQPITSAAVGDLGRSPTGIVEGTWVVGFFLDGEESQQPIIMGTLAGIPEQTASETNYVNEGFNDPNGVYPNRKNEPDVNRLARNDASYDHIIKSGLAGEAASYVPIALSGDTWSQPKYVSEATYPLNHVTETESGHIREYDDTPGSERILEMHRSGTHQFIDASANRTVRVKGENYEVLAKGNNVYINGTCNLTIGGDYNVYVKGNYNLQVDGEMNTKVGSTISLQQTGSGAKYTHAGDVETTANAMKTTTYSLDLNSSGSTKLTADTLDFSIAGDTKHNYQGDYSVRYESDYKYYYGKDTYYRHESGVDYTCPGDDARTGDVDCEDTPTADTAGTAGTVDLTSAVEDTELINGTVVYSNPWHPKNVAPIVAAVFPTSTPSIAEVAATTVLDAEPDTTPANTNIVVCQNFSSTISSADYSSEMSFYYTLADLSIGALFPHKIVAQNGLSEVQIACNLQNLAVSVLDPIRAKYGSAFRINSGFRQRQNGRSDHEFGQAADLQFPGYSRAQLGQVAEWIKNNIPSYKQLILEFMGNGWIHVAYAGSRGSNQKIVLTTTNGSRYTPGLLV